MVFLITAALLFVSSAASSRTLYVDESSTGQQSGTPSQPYRTIAGALAVAQLGDSVQVAPGVYREHLTLKSDVSLVGDGYDTCSIDGGGTGNAIYAGPDVRGAVISGFTITGGGSEWYDSGIWCLGSRVQVVNNKIVRNGSRGVSAYQGAVLDVRQNLILENGVSGVYSFRSQVYVTNNTICSNVREAGITVHETSGAIRNNIIVGNNLRGILVLEKCGGLGLSYNDVWNNPTNYEIDPGTRPPLLPGPGSTSADPVFADAQFRLRESSPCRNAGDPSMGVNPASGDRYDMGALEFVPSSGETYPTVAALFDGYHYNIGDAKASASSYASIYPGDLRGAVLTEPITYERLRPYDIFVFYASWKRSRGVAPTAAEANELRRYVQNGGSVLLYGDDDYWGLWDNAWANTLAAPFSIAFNTDQLLDPTSFDTSIVTSEDDAERHIVFHNLASHPTTRGVDRVWVHGACSLRTTNPSAVAVVRGDGDTYSDRYSPYSAGSYPPAAIALEYGAGRVFAYGDGAIYHSQGKYDDEAFFANVLAWLSGARGSSTAGTAAGLCERLASLPLWLRVVLIYAASMVVLSVLIAALVVWRRKRNRRVHL